MASAAYAITKHRLMNISVVISRALAWTLAAGAFGGVYAALAAAYRAFVSPAIDPAFTAWTVAYCLWCGVYFSRCRLFLQTTTDRAFVKGAYDYRLVQRKLFAELRRAGTLQDAVGIVSGIIDRELDISGARIILPDDPAFDRLKEIGEIVGREERPDLPARLAVPCRVGDKPVALILLEQKRSEEPFDEQDGDMLKTIAEELADTLVRTRPYERVREELSAARAQLDRAQRLAALGTVAAGVAHEIRNPLGVIQLKTARLAPETAANPAALAAYQSEIEQLIGRITDIVRGMLSLSRGETKPREKVDLNEVIDATLGYFNGGAVRVVRENAGPPPVLADREELKQVFINLFDNACRAMPDGGELRVKTCQAGPDAVVEIADAGKGIAAGDLEKIFDPFFSTGGEGAGLGLAIVYRIVREHGGEIGVRSEVGRGTVFTLRFPPAA